MRFERQIGLAFAKVALEESNNDPNVAAAYLLMAYCELTIGAAKALGKPEKRIELAALTAERIIAYPVEE